MKKLIVLCLAALIVLAVPTDAFAKTVAKNGAEMVSSIETNAPQFDFSVGGALLMEASTGTVLYAENEYTAASVASVTKVMTLLLVCEALSEGRISLGDTVMISEYAASMGGSQIFLEEGEMMSVEELIKSTVIASGNDSAVALAEHVAGSEVAFVSRMNARAAELGLKNSSFENVTGLDDTTTKHYSCAADIAVMSRELIKHDIILKYSSTWQDSVRNGEFVLTNTNRLVRFYEGCNGLKTGSTDKAGYCVSAAAKRGNMQLIAVILGAVTRDGRNDAARKLLDFGFANFALYERGEQTLETVPVKRGVLDGVEVYTGGFCALVDKGKLSSVELKYDIPEELTAPISEGEKVGSVVYMIDGEAIGSSDILTAGGVEKITLGEIFLRILQRIFCGA